MTATVESAAQAADATEPLFVITAASNRDMQDFTRVRWQGWLAPLGRRAGDLRPGVPMPTSGRLKSRRMPLPFFWQRETSHGGQIVNGAYEVGAVTYADIRPNPHRGDEPWIWGAGFIDLNDQDGLRYARRLEDGMSRWISVKLDFDPEFEPPAEFLADKKDDDHISPTDHPDWWRLMNVTAESQPAFDGAEIELADDLDDLLDSDEHCDSADGDHDCGDDEPAVDDVEEDLPSADGPSPLAHPELRLVSTGGGTGVSAMSSTVSTTMQLPPEAAENGPPGDAGPASGGSGPSNALGGKTGDHGGGDALIAVVTGDTKLPFAPREHAWNGPEAAKRLIEWAGGRFSLDVQKMARAHLYRDSKMSPKMATSWKFPIADVIKGEVRIVPRAVFTAAAVLRGSMGGTKIPSADQQAMRRKVTELYKRMAEEFDDPKIKSPFESVISDAHAGAMTDPDVTPGDPPPWRLPEQRRGERRRLPNLTASATSWAARVAQSIPVEPPRDWFSDPGLGKPTKIRVTDEGRIFGHVAAWHTDHAAFPGVRPPRNRDKSYSKFHRHPVRCAGGEIVKTGPLATGGHTSTDVALAIETVQAHYDDPRYVVGDVVCGEDEYGIWVSGALRPGVSPFQVMLADRYSFSGDWRYGELLAACSVSVPGFHLDADEEIGTLTAAAAGAGVQDLPVVAEAEQVLVADSCGTPLVLIAAGVVVEQAEEEAAAQVRAAIDGLGQWLRNELASLRAEFGMTDTTTAPSPDQVITQLKELVNDEFKALRDELGLNRPGGAQPEAETQAVADTTSETSTAPSAPAPADRDTVQPPADDTAGQQATTAAGALNEVAEFKTWLAEQFATLRADRAAEQTAIATPAATPAATADFAAERKALLADVHGDARVDEAKALFALVHEVA